MIDHMLVDTFSNVCKERGLTKYTYDWWDMSYKIWHPDCTVGDQIHKQMNTWREHFNILSYGIYTWSYYLDEETR